MQPTSRALLTLTGLLLTVAVLAPLVVAHSPGDAGRAVQIEPRVLPSWLGWAAGAAVVAVSFALVALFLTQDTVPRRVQGRSIEAGEVTGLPRRVVSLARLAGLLVLAMVILAALVPWSPGPAAERLMWIGLWAGLPMVAYGVGNVWVVVSPFRALAGFAERLRGGHAAFEYPERVGAWPSVVLALSVLGFEVMHPGSVWVGRVALVYTLFTVVGMATFGSRVWLERVEVFDRLFAWWSTVAPGRLTERGWRWRAPGAELARREGVGWGDAAFLVALLFGAKVEGFLSTSFGAWGMERFAAAGTASGVLAALAGFGLFLGVFALAVHVVAETTVTSRSRGALAGVFAVSLLPIAVGYHVAHNLPFVVDNAPLVWGALADPLGLAGGAGGSVVGVSRFGDAIAGLQVALVVLGHVAGVFAGHVRAFSAFPSKVQAVKAELAVTGAMVVFTLVSLWIVSSAHAGGSL